jgi:hypothetical protein
MDDDDRKPSISCTLAILLAMLVIAGIGVYFSVHNLFH